MKTPPKHLVRKHFRLDSRKLKRAQKLLKASTETEAIERALDLIIDEHGRDRVAWEAHERFLKSGIEIRDLYRKLSD
jgi:hypothetical protein